MKKISIILITLFSFLSYGSSDVGGPFKLTNSKGEEFGTKQLKGKYFLVFFGFTRCPSVCPLGVRTMTKVQKQLAKTVNIETVFITIDPDFDTFTQLKTFKATHSSRLHTLRGTQKEIDEVITKFRGFYSKGKVAEIEHSSIIYFMNKNGTFINYYDSGIGVKKISDSILKNIKK